MKYFLIGIFVTFLSACSNSVDFSRPANERIVLGQTKLSDMAGLIYHEPISTSTQYINGKQIFVLEYAHVGPNNESDSKAPGVIPIRSLHVYLYNDIVVGTSFFSSFEKDSTKFNPEQAKKIEIDISTQEDVIRLFGAPNLQYLEEMGINGQKVIGYRYKTTHFRAAGGNGYTENLKLTFLVNRNKTVTRIKLNVRKM